MPSEGWVSSYGHGIIYYPSESNQHHIWWYALPNGIMLEVDDRLPHLKTWKQQEIWLKEQFSLNGIEVD